MSTFRQTHAQIVPYNVRMTTENPDLYERIERMSIRLDFAMARKWLRENPLSPDQPTVRIMLSKLEKPVSDDVAKSRVKPQLVTWGQPCLSILVPQNLD
jgi:hypothetical protein